jgi:hypothetical protein
LLANENLLNIFIDILLSKTNLYDSCTLIKSIEMIDHFFGYFKMMKRKLPTTFAYSAFYEGAKIILEGDHCFAIAKVYHLNNVVFTVNL